MKQTPDMVVRDENPNMNIGWMADSLKRMGAARAWVDVLTNKVNVVIAQTYPLFTAHRSERDLFTACKVAVQGSAVKTVTPLLATAGADSVVNLTGNKCFGVRIKYGNSPLNFKYGAYTITIGDGATALGQIVVRPSTNMFDVVVLGFNNNAGQASIVPILNPRVTVVDASSTQTTGDALVVESLNERDLGQLAGS